MAGHELATEGFRPGQVGSSAMPHKMNTRSCERIDGFRAILDGPPHDGRRGLAGDQWNEGDVSCSVVRRVALPDAFFAIDGLFETLLHVLDDFGAYPGGDRAGAATATCRSSPPRKVLMAAVRAGVGREEAHEVIKEHAVAVALAMREQGAEGNDLLERLAADERLGLVADEPRPPLMAEPLDFVGNAAPPGGGVRRPRSADAGRRGTPRRRPTAGRPADPVEHRGRRCPDHRRCRTSTRARSVTSTTPATTGC